jgi:excinuclease ABC subunit B
VNFKLAASFKPAGDQPEAIAEIVRRLKGDAPYTTLLGVTGSGKTFTAANVIATLGRPTLVISHNKTLVAQLYSEFKELFPENAVEYFVSYYDYYQPEAYIPQTDTYIEKDSSINEDIDRLRLRATSSILSRRDCIIVASVSCIYGLGSPGDYANLLVIVEKGQTLDRDALLRRLVDIRYERNDADFKRGTFRVKGDVVDVYLAYEETGIRLTFDYDTVTSVRRIHPVTAETLHELDAIAVYPAKHFVTTPERIEVAARSIRGELDARLAQLRGQHKLLEAQRLEQRTRYDLEMLEALGYCSGIENYSRHLAGREPGSRPYCLLDYFPEDFLVVIDESHVTLPQIRGMYNGDRARKETLVEFGFRLPSALDNRPLRFDEFEALVKQTLYVSATPSEYETRRSGGAVEQIIRPTGLLDPTVEIRPTRGQVDDLIAEVKKRAEAKERTLVTTLTKRMSEDLTRYLKDLGLRVRYLHSEIDAIERVEILRDLRLGRFDCLVGINLLREGLDLPEVSLVAVLDADNEGFLRSATSLIQTAGRAARHANGRVILYADRLTDSIKVMVAATERRRRIQEAYNARHGITPRGIEKKIVEGIESIKRVRELVREATGLDEDAYDRQAVIADLESEMEEAARNLQFERAILLRDQIRKLRKDTDAPTRERRIPAAPTPPKR